MQNSQNNSKLTSKANGSEKIDIKDFFEQEVFARVKTSFARTSELRTKITNYTAELEERDSTKIYKRLEEILNKTPFKEIIAHDSKIKRGNKQEALKDLIGQLNEILKSDPSNKEVEQFRDLCEQMRTDLSRQFARPEEEQQNRTKVVDAFKAFVAKEKEKGGGLPDNLSGLIRTLRLASNPSNLTPGNREAFIDTLKQQINVNPDQQTKIEEIIKEINNLQTILEASQNNLANDLKKFSDLDVIKSFNSSASPTEKLNDITNFNNEIENETSSLIKNLEDYIKDFKGEKNLIKELDSLHFKLERKELSIEEILLKLNELKTSTSIDKSAKELVERMYKHFEDKQQKIFLISELVCELFRQVENSNELPNEQAVILLKLKQEKDKLQNSDDANKHYNKEGKPISPEALAIKVAYGKIISHLDKDKKGLEELSIKQKFYLLLATNPDDRLNIKSYIPDCVRITFTAMHQVEKISQESINKLLPDNSLGLFLAPKTSGKQRPGPEGGYYYSNGKTSLVKRESHGDAPKYANIMGEYLTGRMYQVSQPENSPNIELVVSNSSDPSLPYTNNASRLYLASELASGFKDDLFKHLGIEGNNKPMLVGTQRKLHTETGNKITDFFTGKVPGWNFDKVAKEFADNYLALDIFGEDDRHIGNIAVRELNGELRLFSFDFGWGLHNYGKEFNPRELIYNLGEPTKHLREYPLELLTSQPAVDRYKQELENKDKYAEAFNKGLDELFMKLQPDPEPFRQFAKHLGMDTDFSSRENAEDIVKEIKGYFEVAHEARFKGVEKYYLDLRFTRIVNEVKAQAAIELYLEHLHKDLRNDIEGLKLLFSNIEGLKKQIESSTGNTEELKNKLKKEENILEQKLKKYSLVAIGNDKGIRDYLKEDNPILAIDNANLFNNAASYFQRESRTLWEYQTVDSINRKVFEKVERYGHQHADQRREKYNMLMDKNKNFLALVEEYQSPEKVEIIKSKIEEGFDYKGRGFTNADHWNELLKDALVEKSPAFQAERPRRKPNIASKTISIAESENEFDLTNSPRSSISIDNYDLQSLTDLPLDNTDKLPKKRVRFRDEPDISPSYRSNQVSHSTQTDFDDIDQDIGGKGRTYAGENRTQHKITPISQYTANTSLSQSSHLTKSVNPTQNNKIPYPSAIQRQSEEDERNNNHALYDKDAAQQKRAETEKQLKSGPLKSHYYTSSKKSYMEIVGQKVLTCIFVATGAAMLLASVFTPPLLIVAALSFLTAYKINKGAEEKIENYGKKPNYVDNHQAEKNNLERGKSSSATRNY